MTRCTLLIALILGSGAAAAQPYPTRPITIIVPYAPGGTGELLGRLMGQEMQKTLGQSMVVELRPGAGGNIGAEFAAKQARNDGYTILFAASSLATSVSLMKLNYDPRRDLTPVSGVGAIPNLAVVSADSAVRSMVDLVAAAKKDAGAVTFGSSGPGTGSHLAGEFFKVQAGIAMTHVPYKSTGVAYPDLIANRVAVLFDVMGGSALSQVKGGKVRAIGISSARRSASLPEVPTIAEQGFPGFEFVTWFGFFAPAGTSAEAIQRLEQATGRARETAEVKDRFVQIAAEPIPVGAAEFGRYFLADVDRWARLVRDGKVAPIQ